MSAEQMEVENPKKGEQRSTEEKNKTPERQLLSPSKRDIGSSRNDKTSRDYISRRSYSRSRSNRRRYDRKRSYSNNRSHDLSGSRTRARDRSRSYSYGRDRRRSRSRGRYRSKSRSRGRSPSRSRYRRRSRSSGRSRSRRRGRSRSRSRARSRSKSRSRSRTRGTYSRSRSRSISRTRRTISRKRNADSSDVGSAYSGERASSRSLKPESYRSRSREKHHEEGSSLKQSPSSSITGAQVLAEDDKSKIAGANEVVNIEEESEYLKELKLEFPAKYEFLLAKRNFEALRLKNTEIHAISAEKLKLLRVSEEWMKTFVMNESE